MNGANPIDFLWMLQYNMIATFKLKVLRCSYEDKR